MKNIDFKGENSIFVQGFKLRESSVANFEELPLAVDDPKTFDVGNLPRARARAV